MFDGAVSVDEINFPSRGFARHDAAHARAGPTQRWSIYWINSTNGREPARQCTVASTANDGESSYGTDSDDGRAGAGALRPGPALGPDAARWQQAFALEGRRRGKRTG